MKKILVIEDDASLREFMIKYFLEKQGYAVITAENGAVGLEKAKHDIPDLIISDIMMPQMNGYEVLRALQQSPDTAEIPFIFLTAMSNRSDIRNGMNLGADDFLVKPFMSQELLNAINKRFEKKAKLEIRANQRLENLREKIARVLPHEFRTPLSTILGVSNILLEECDDMPKDELKEMLTFLNVSAKRLNRLIENYLLYVSLENIVDFEELRSASVMVSKEFILEQFAQQAQRYDRVSDLVVEGIPDDDSISIAISEPHFVKLIEEVCDNACKFSEKDTPIHITLSTRGNSYVISCSNAGVGMTHQQIQEIGAFMQFERELREQQGAGLGLVLARKIVELHDGSLTIESIPHVSTTFRITLPIAVNELSYT